MSTLPLSTLYQLAGITPSVTPDPFALPPESDEDDESGIAVLQRLEAAEAARAEQTRQMTQSAAMMPRPVGTGDPAMDIPIAPTSPYEASVQRIEELAAQPPPEDIFGRIGQYGVRESQQQIAAGEAVAAAATGVVTGAARGAAFAAATIPDAMNLIQLNMSRMMRSHTPTYYRDLIRDLDASSAQLQYVPRSELGGAITDVVNLPFVAIDRLGTFTQNTAVAAGVNPDDAAALKEMTELVALAGTVPLVSRGLSRMRSRVADFRNRMRTSDVTAVELHESARRMRAEYYKDPEFVRRVNDLKARAGLAPEEARTPSTGETAAPTATHGTLVDPFFDEIYALTQRNPNVTAAEIREAYGIDALRAARLRNLARTYKPEATRGEPLPGERIEVRPPTPPVAPAPTVPDARLGTVEDPLYPAVYSEMSRNPRVRPDDIMYLLDIDAQRARRLHGLSALGIEPRSEPFRETPALGAGAPGAPAVAQPEAQLRPTVIEAPASEQFGPSRVLEPRPPYTPLPGSQLDRQMYLVEARNVLRDPNALPAQRARALEVVRDAAQTVGIDRTPVPLNQGLRNLGFTDAEIGVLAPEIEAIGRPPAPEISPAMHADRPRPARVAPSPAIPGALPDDPNALPPIEPTGRADAELEMANATQALRANPRDPAAQQRVRDAAARVLEFSDLGTAPPSAATTRTTPVTPVLETPGERTPLQRAIDAQRAGTATRDDLAVIKYAAREGLSRTESTAHGLETLGFTPEEIAVLHPQLRTIRAVRPAQTQAPIGEATTPAPARAPLGEQRFYDVDALGDITPTLDNRTYYPGERRATATDAPIKIGFVETERPAGVRGDYTGVEAQAILVDSTGMNLTTSAAQIAEQVASGQMPQTTGAAYMNRLARQARVLGVPLEEAHSVPGENLLAKAAQIARERGLDLYRYNQTTRTYDQVMNETVRTIDDLHGGDAMAASDLTPEKAAAYADAVKPAVDMTMIDMMNDALELGVDISAQLPAELVPHFKALFDNGRRGLSGTERRRFTDILQDLLTITRGVLRDERGIIGTAGLDNAQKLAFQRIRNDVLRRGRTVMGEIRKLVHAGRLTPEQATLYESYNNTLHNPPPESSVTPANEMRFDPVSRAPEISRHVSESGVPFPPVYMDDAILVQDAAARTPKIPRWSTNPIYLLEKYGLEPYLYAYREAQRLGDRWVKEMAQDVRALRRNFTPDEHRDVVAYLYDKNPEGRRLNHESGVTVPPVLDARRTQLEGIYRRTYDFLFEKINEVRAQTGLDPLFRVPDYMTFLRAFTVRDALGITDSLLTSPAQAVNDMFLKYRTTDFPYAKRRTGAYYRADYDGPHILQTYANSALRHIALSPVSAKIHELINKTMPSLTTPGESFSLLDANPQLHRTLQQFNNQILQRVPHTIDEAFDTPQAGQKARRAVEILTRNTATSVLSYNVASALRQLGGMLTTYHQIGLADTMRGVADYVGSLFANDRVTPALRESSLLDVRSYYNTEQSFVDAWQTASATKAFGAFVNLGFATHRWLDSAVATIAYLGARRVGERNGLTGKDLRNFADNVVAKTQGSTMPGEMTRLQASDWGRAIFSMSGPQLAAINYLGEEVFGIGRDMSGRKRTASIGRFLIGMGIFSFLFEHLTRLRSPWPTPIGSPEERDNWLFDYAADIAGFIPVVGPVLGGLQYGRGMTMPVGGTIEEFGRAANAATAQGARSAALRGAARSIGVPLSVVESVDLFFRGENFMRPYYRTIRQDEPDTDFLPRPPGAARTPLPPGVRRPRQ